MSPICCFYHENVLQWNLAVALKNFAFVEKRIAMSDAITF